MVSLDGANFFYAQQKMDWWIDPKRFLAWIEEQYGQIVDAYYYLGVPRQNKDKHQRYVKALQRMGFRVRTKPIKIYDKGDPEKHKAKANLDTSIVLDIMNGIDNFDLLVLISGDGDFEELLKTVETRGKRFVVISTHSFVAQEILLLAGQHYVDFNTIREEIEKDQSMRTRSVESEIEPEQEEELAATPQED